MAKVTTKYICSNCGAHSPVMMGRCPRCNAWGTMEEQQEQRSGGGNTLTGRRRAPQGAAVTVQSLAEITDKADLQRFSSGIPEVDRVLGGGWVPGAVMLLAGEPGIGKSTLLLQLSHEARVLDKRVLYVSGEESPSQVKLRAQRLGVSDTLVLTRETDARVLAEHLRQDKPHLAIIDSVQTLNADDEGTPGSLTQVRDATAILTQAAKDAGSTLVLIGHITKQGSIAGPKVIEHVVDATLVLESASGFRVLRAMKNRFGAAGEMGVFEMTSDGMTAISNPSEAFLAEMPKGVPGSVVVATLEGQRPLLLEVQALAAKSPYSSPKRVVQGLDQRRVDVVLAVLERRIELPLAGLDVYVNVAGGLRIADPGADLAVALAVYSAVTNRVLPEGTAVVGEVGLTGEVRSVPQLARRVTEAGRASFERVVGPRRGAAAKEIPKEMVLLGVMSLAEALELTWQA